ncbi:hypothetical protein, partial [Escherichia coli]|uniref:hypothetical protein n=1 Tax=Escherichia coli TaxID=562 RepID=UPI0029F49526
CVWHACNPGNRTRKKLAGHNSIYEFSAVCRSDKALTPHPTITALPDATLPRLIRPCIIPPVQRKSASFLK